MWTDWIRDARIVVLAAARQQVKASGLPRDEHCVEDAHAHARDGATAACAANPGFFTDEQHCRRWMVRTARNHVRDQGRRERARHKHEASYERPESAPDYSALWAEIRAALPDVPPRSRELLGLLFEGRSVNEIAARLGAPPAKVYPLRVRALADLRRVLALRGVTAADLCRPSAEFGPDRPDDG